MVVSLIGDRSLFFKTGTRGNVNFASKDRIDAFFLACLVKVNDKITQLVLLPIITPDLELVNSLDETDRGDKGFGSTGR